MLTAAIDDTYLGKVCRYVQPLENITELIGAMLSACYEDGDQIAVGLAANQCGCDLRVIVVDYGGFKGGMVNPIITKYRGGTSIAEEGCLSFEGEFTYPVRHKIIQVTWVDENWREHRRKFRGLLARIIQHEIDHLDGITMFDREIMGAVK